MPLDRYQLLLCNASFIGQFSYYDSRVKYSRRDNVNVKENFGNIATVWIQHSVLLCVLREAVFLQLKHVSKIVVRFLEEAAQALAHTPNHFAEERFVSFLTSLLTPIISPSCVLLLCKRSFDHPADVKWKTLVSHNLKIVAVILKVTQSTYNSTSKTLQSCMLFYDVYLFFNSFGGCLV